MSTPIHRSSRILLYHSLASIISLLALVPALSMAEAQQGSLVTPSNITESSNNQICTALFEALPGKVSLPSDSGYDASLKSYFSQQEAEITPYCIVSPLNESDVSTAVKILAAPDSTTKFAIRGGGHTVWKGSANIEDGVTIDLRNMNTVKVSEDKTVISVGAGALWRDVYTVTDSLGLATSGGRAAQVGVGGLTTGGISTFSSNQYSLTKTH